MDRARDTSEQGKHLSSEAKKALYKKRSVTGGDLSTAMPNNRDSSDGAQSKSKGFPSEVLNNPADLTSQEDEEQ